MATFVYAGVPLMMLRTEEYDVQAVNDEANVDFQLLRITLGFRCLWSPNTTASNRVVQANNTVVGDRLGVSLDNLVQVLMQPRQALTYWIGNDLVYQSPVPDATDTLLFSDADGGPRPLSCRIIEIHGTKSAVVHYRITFTQVTGSNIVLSNRWNVTADVDGDTWLTTLTTNGRATLRSDLLQANSLIADQFRKAFFLPIPLGFARKSVRVIQTPDGRELAWTTVDQQQALCLGTGQVITRVEGACSVGASSNWKNIVEAASAGADIVWNMATMDFRGTLRGIGKAIKNTIPVVHGHCNLRCWGPPSTGGSVRAQMATFLVELALDRFTVRGSRPPFTSAHLITSVEKPYCELKMDFFGGPKTLANAILNMRDFGQRMNLSDDFSGAAGKADGVGAMEGYGGRCPTPPNSSGTRGLWVGPLLAQVLRQPGVLPAVPSQDAMNSKITDQPLR